ncbi:MAG: hypothetical protein KDD56_01125 [Bdellovibrionales bacterium]|nr:hypothetical protein [Bdellovibrionales bacterium]
MFSNNPVSVTGIRAREVISASEKITTCRGLEIDKSKVGLVIFGGTSTLASDTKGIVYDLVSELCSGGTLGTLITSKNLEEANLFIKEKELGNFLTVGSYDAKQVEDAVVDQDHEIIVFENDPRDISGIIAFAHAKHHSVDIIFKLQVDSDVEELVKYLQSVFQQFSSFKGHVFILQDSYSKIHINDSRAPEFTVPCDNPLGQVSFPR